MLLAPGSVCKVCQRIFCCAECCRKHVVEQHAIAVRPPSGKLNAINSKYNINNKNNKNIPYIISRSSTMDTIFMCCPICEQQPLSMGGEQMYDEVLTHIATKHLPLYCRRCAKAYTKIDDLKDFTKCCQPYAPCASDAVPAIESVEQQQQSSSLNSNADNTCDTDASKVTVKRATAIAQSTISTQTSPMVGLSGSSSLEANQLIDATPMTTAMHLLWQLKSSKMITHEEFLSGGDSVSSIKNLSSICNNSGLRSASGSIGSHAHIVSSGQRGQVKSKLVRSTSTPVHAALCYVKPKEQTFNGSGGYVSSIYHSGCELDHSPAVAPLAHSVSTSPRQSATETLQRYRKMGGRNKLTEQTPLRQVMSKSIQKAMAEHGLPGEGGGGGATSPLDLRLTPVRQRNQIPINYGDATVAAASSKVDPGNNNNNNNIDVNGYGSVSRLVHGNDLRRRDVVRMSSTKQMKTEAIVITRTQRMSSASGECIGGATCSSNSMSASQSKSNGNIELSHVDEKSTASSASSASTASVYQTCHSVEIITATEVTAEEVYTSASAASTSAVATAAAALVATEQRTSQHQSMALTAGTQHALLQANDHATALNEIYTPITRIPGAIINKKVINFETPASEAISVPNALRTPKAKMQSSARAGTVSPGTDKFYTPSSSPLTTPLMGHAAGEEGSPPSLQERRPSVSRNLNGHFDVTALRGRPTYRRSERQRQRSAQVMLERGERVENVEERDNVFNTDDDGDVDVDDGSGVGGGDNDISRRNRAKSTATTNEQRNPKHIATIGRSWSLGAIVSSVMRLPSLRGVGTGGGGGGGTAVAITNGTEMSTPSPSATTNSILKRCASIAGSLVRSKSLNDDEQIKAMKRKRTYTVEPNATVSYRTPTSPVDNWRGGGGGSGSGSDYGGSSSRSVSTNMSLQSPEGHSTTAMAIASKRFRIQPRKPIQRMRLSNN